MTVREAKERRMIWGGKPCSHPEREEERDDIETSTGDYVCTDAENPMRKPLE